MTPSNLTQLEDFPSIYIDLNHYKVLADEKLLNTNDANEIEQLYRLAKYELGTVIGTEKVKEIMKGVYSGE